MNCFQRPKFKETRRKSIFEVKLMRIVLNAFFMKNKTQKVALRYLFN
jgi:hypothetical protein